MLKKRYQVFITTSGIEMQAERMLISQTLAGMGFFSWGLEQRTALSTNFVRRQIDDCDYVLLAIGPQYGEQSVSGLSYQHLEYIYALTKQKPMIVFMLENSSLQETSLKTKNIPCEMKREDFCQQLKNEVEQVVLYRNLRDLEFAIRAHMPKMLEYYPTAGWIRPQTVQVLQTEIKGLKGKLARIADRQREAEIDSSLTSAKISLKELFNFDYRMHAYQDGNFKELSATREMAWGELLTVLSTEFTQPRPEDCFAKVLNKYLNNTGLIDAKVLMPRAHAISQAQIKVRSLHFIKQQVHQNEWIVPIERDEHRHKLWKMTEKCTRLLKKSVATRFLDIDPEMRLKCR